MYLNPFSEHVIPQRFLPGCQLLRTQNYLLLETGVFRNGGEAPMNAFSTPAVLEVQSLHAISIKSRHCVCHCFYGKWILNSSSLSRAAGADTVFLAPVSCQFIIPLNRGWAREPLCSVILKWAVTLPAQTWASFPCRALGIHCPQGRRCFPSKSCLRLCLYLLSVVE